MPEINLDICKGCGLCVDACPNYAITIENKKARIDKDVCLECEVCISSCPNHAILSNIHITRYPYRYPRPYPKYTLYYPPNFQRIYHPRFQRRRRRGAMKI